MELNKTEKSPKHTEEKVFFSGINALRFFAALGVIITHIELLKGVFGFQHLWNDPVFFSLGGLGVYFFFVLSGFLITYLLLKEKEKTGKILIKQFYFRRILRIWPLYYLICLLGFFVLPQFTGIQISYLSESFKEHFTPNLVLYLLIFPNLAFSMFPAVPHIGQAWSIGVEEQFYIAWPWIILKSKKVLRSLVIIVLLLIFIKIGVLILGKIFQGESWYLVLKNFVAMSKFECMAIGGIGAYYLHINDQNVLRHVYSNWLFVLSLLSIPILIYFTPDQIQDGIHLVYAFFFLIIILNVASNKRSGKFLENKYFSYLGKISYGIYMYHFMIIPIVLYSYQHFGFDFHPFVFNIAIYTVVILLTIGISGCSYTLIESRFIKLKGKYTIIKSGSQMNETD